MIDEVKKLLGPERLDRLAAMPLVAERGGVEKLLADACAATSSAATALALAIRTAGGKLSKEDVERLKKPATASGHDAFPQPIGGDVPAKALQGRRTKPESATE